MQREQDEAGTIETHCKDEGGLLGTVAHTHNPSYLGGQDKKIRSLRSVWATYKILSQKTKTKKI